MMEEGRWLGWRDDEREMIDDRRTGVDGNTDRQALGERKNGHLKFRGKTEVEWTKASTTQNDIQKYSVVGKQTKLEFFRKQGNLSTTEKQADRLWVKRSLKIFRRLNLGYSRKNVE
jgi:hypothetical protein